MQDCAKYDNMLNARVDGTLNKKDAKELDKHLAACADCRKYLQLLEDIRDGLHEDLPDPPETLREGIMYKIGLEKHRKLHFGAMGRWTAIAAVLCVVIFGVVKLTGSGVMKAAAPEAAPALYSANGGGATADTAGAEDGGMLYESKLAVKGNAAVPEEAPAPVPVPAPASAAGGAVANDQTSRTEETDSIGGTEKEPENGSVYLAGSLPGYDIARAALDSGDWWGVCIFYGALPEGLGAGSWQTKIPEEGEKERWQLSSEALQALEKGAEWDEFYYGDWNSGQGLVIVIADEEE